jgi:hypothetical protein
MASTHKRLFCCWGVDNKNVDFTTLTQFKSRSGSDGDDSHLAIIFRLEFGDEFIEKPGISSASCGG